MYFFNRLIFGETMVFEDHSPKISLTVLGTLCFVTLVMTQTGFKISKELTHEIYPPILRSKDCWFLYTIENPDRFKCILKAFIVLTSPIISLVATAALLFGKIESNPYFFIPWLFLALRGLLLIQTDNIITLLRDMGNKSNYLSGFRLEDAKSLLFYSTVFVMCFVEALSFCEILDIFLDLWNHHPGCNLVPVTLKAIKEKIMEALSKCSLESLSKISISSISESEDNIYFIKKSGAKESENLGESPDVLSVDSILKIVDSGNINSTWKSGTEVTQSESEKMAKSQSRDDKGHSLERTKSSKKKKKKIREKVKEKIAELPTISACSFQKFLNL